MILMIIFTQQIKKFGINFTKSNAKFCLSLNCHGEQSYMRVNKTEICKFKDFDNINPY